MKCPTCSTELKIAERQGVEIDHCPQCRGVWLDRGELDKIIERSNREIGPRAQMNEPSPRYDEPARRHDDDDDDHVSHDQRHPHKKRRSWLGDLLDFD
ncbi:MAG: zf-TFIIB domain-containing protein [Phycisphaerales bacterium]|nr:zf-TFIIB domain-containing protein [Phycisphaerales bacterium]